MKRERVALSFCALLLSIPLSLTAEEFHIVGSRAMGMGGAGVAVTRGVLSTYWNPAALCPPAFSRSAGFLDLALPLAVMGTVSRDALRELDAAIDFSADVDFQGIGDRIAADKPLTVEQMESLLALAGELPDLETSGSGFLADVSLGLGLRLDRLAFNSIGLFSAGAVTRLDRNNLALGDDIENFLPDGNGEVPESEAGRSLVNELVEAGFLSEADANLLVFFAEEAGVDLTSSSFREMIEDILEATDNSSTGDVITANQSGVEISGIFIQEYAVSYAHPLKEWFSPSVLDSVSIGATLKVMNAKTFFAPFSLSALETFDGIDGDLLTEAREETSLNIGLDLGLLAQPADGLSLGVVARNINGPSFDFARAGDYKIDPQVRAGVGFYNLLPNTILAMDIDLTRNRTDALPGYESQQVAAGLEYLFLGRDDILLRCGVSHNLAGAEGPSFHFGFGFSLANVAIDMSGMLTPRMTEIERGADGILLELPERAGVSLMIGCRIPLR